MRSLFGCVLVMSLGVACRAPTVCTPGKSEACVGPGGCQGGQRCNADGSAYEACICASGVTGGGAGATGGGTGGGSALDAGHDAGTPDAGPLSELPYIQTDRVTLGFGREFGRGVLVGTRVVETLQVRNAGQQTLTVSSVQLQDSVQGQFAIQVSPGGGADGGVWQLATFERAFVQVSYTPDDAGVSTTSLQIISNAGNSTQLTVPLSAEAVRP